MTIKEANRPFAEGIGILIARKGLKQVALISDDTTGIIFIKLSPFLSYSVSAHL